jgi:PPP family 3-phenylpropionic acid transporter
MFTIGAAVVQWLGPVRALAVSGLAGILRWGAMMSDPALVLLWPLQAMHALTFATGHLGAMAFISQAVPARYGAAAQGAMGSMAVGLLLALGMAVASVVYPALGGATYGIGAAFSGIGLVVVGRLARRWKGQAIDV